MLKSDISDNAVKSYTQSLKYFLNGKYLLAMRDFSMNIYQRLKSTIGGGNDYYF